MRNKILFLSIALILGAFIALLGQTSEVRGTGAPSDNSTMPNSPVIDLSQDELKPLVNYTLQGPTLQAASTPPSFIPSFIPASEREKYKITADETWYLDVDINTPGWLYIYEYFPAGADSQGKWIAYKWELLESGIWRLGPFTADDNEPEGQHTYRIWFYSDGQWAGEVPNTLQNNLVFWTYSKGQPAEQSVEQISPPPPVAPAEETTFLDRLQGFIASPMMIWLGPLILVIIVAPGLYMYWRYTRRDKGQNPIPVSEETESEEPSAELASGVPRAKIGLPNGLEIRIASDSKVIGRGDLARALGLDELGRISRRHFQISSECEQFYIEDLSSANGTKLNGTDISGKGPVSLNSNDVIEPAGAVNLKFLIL